MPKGQEDYPTDFLNDIPSHYLNKIPKKAEQVGGSHYKSDYEHWDWARDSKLGYLEGAATKYIIRHKGDRVEDLKKAASYLLKAKEDNISLGYLNQGQVDIKLLRRFSEKNNLDLVQEYLCFAIVWWTNPEDIDLIVLNIHRYIEQISGQK